MQHEIKHYRLTLIDDPVQNQVVAWEQAARSFKNEDAKPVLNRIMAELRNVKVTDNPASFLPVFQMVFESLETALNIINNNETLTLSSNHGVMVKAAIKTGWILLLEKIPESADLQPAVLTLTPEQVDGWQPWLVSWIAEQIAKIYMEATTVPKN